MDIKLIRMQFPIDAATDNVISVQGQTYLGGVTVNSLVLSNPQFYLTKDYKGKDVLCTVVVDGIAPLQAVFNNAGGNYTLVAVPMPVQDYIGGHPKERPPHY